MSFTKLLVSEIPSGDGKTANFFTVYASARIKLTSTNENNAKPSLKIIGYNIVCAAYLFIYLAIFTKWNEHFLLLLIVLYL